MDISAPGRTYPPPGADISVPAPPAADISAAGPCWKVAAVRGCLHRHCEMLCLAIMCGWDLHDFYFAVDVETLVSQSVAIRSFQGVRLGGPTPERELCSGAHALGGRRLLLREAQPCLGTEVAFGPGCDGLPWARLKTNMAPDRQKAKNKTANGPED